MLTPVLAAALAMVAPVQDVDTLFGVERGARLDIDNHRGEVVVRAWNRDEVRVQADGDDRDAEEGHHPRDLSLERGGRRPFLRGGFFRSGLARFRLEGRRPLARGRFSLGGRFALWSCLPQLLHSTTLNLNRGIGQEG